MYPIVDPNITRAVDRIRQSVNQYITEEQGVKIYTEIQKLVDSLNWLRKLQLKTILFLKDIGVAQLLEACGYDLEDYLHIKIYSNFFNVVKIRMSVNGKIIKTRTFKLQIDGYTSSDA